jgi:hypothetical protein
MIHGNFQNNFFAMTSCDPLYLADHGPAFVASVAKAGNNCHINVVLPTQSAMIDIADYTKAFRALRKYNTQSISFTFSEFDITGKKNEEIRTYYACSRFIVASDLLNFGSGSMFITDVDCIFMDVVPEPDANLGIFLRESLPGTVGWEAEGTRVAAGAVYYNRNIGMFADSVSSIIQSSPLAWFLDQVALSRCYTDYKDSMNVHLYDSKFMDWEFIEGTTIWTGKGPRKYNNPVYVAKKNEYTKMFREALQ